MFQPARALTRRWYNLQRKLERKESRKAKRKKGRKSRLAPNSCQQTTQPAPLHLASVSFLFYFFEFTFSIESVPISNMFIRVQPSIAATVALLL